MQLIFSQQITDHSASSISKAINEPQLAAMAEWVTLLEKKISPSQILPLCCHLPVDILDWGYLPGIPTMELDQPAEPSRSGGCVFRGLGPFSRPSPLPPPWLVRKQRCGLTPGQEIGGEGACYEIRAHLTSLIGFMKLRELIHAPYFTKWRHFYGRLQRKTGTSLGQILGHFWNLYKSALCAFQHVCDRHVSVHSTIPFVVQPATVGFAVRHLKGFFELSAMTPWYPPYLTEIMWKLLQCTNSSSAFLHRAFKEKQ